MRNPHVYHRSPKRIESFDPARMKFGDYGPGFYFSEEPTLDYVYGRWLHEADVDLERPLDLEGAPPAEVERVARALRVADHLYPDPEAPPLIQAMRLAQAAWDAGEGYRPAAVIRVLEKLGYDGIVVPSKGYWIAFRSEQARGLTASRVNPDEPLRRSQRRARASGDVHEEARYLSERLRRGTILSENLRVASYLGYVPAQLAIDWRPPEPPYGSPDDVMLAVAQDNEWGHQTAALWAYALCKGTEWIWREINNPRGIQFPTISMAPGNALQDLIEVFLEQGTPCPNAEEHSRQLQIYGFRERLADVARGLDGVAFGAGDADPRESLLAEAAGQWVKALADALTIWGPNMHPCWTASLWGNRHTLGQLWVKGIGDTGPSTNVPLYARTAREVYRQVVWAVDFYRGGNNRPGPVMDKAQLDVEAWTRKIMLPELLV